MAVTLSELSNYCDQLLRPWLYQDYCPNGLQVEGVQQVERIVTGVTASKALIEAAVAARAQVILVHHGYFWKGGDPCVTGMLRDRLALLLQHGISLIAYHLPLDGHPEVGNNVQLAARLGLEINGDMGEEMPGIGLTGRLRVAMSGEQFATHLAAQLGRAPLHVPGSSSMIETIAWCSGAAQGLIAKAGRLGVDAYLTGEVSEPTVHVARETGIHFFAAGHHATERYGIQALGSRIAEHFSLAHQFIDIDNPA